MRNPQFVRKNGARLGVKKTYKLFVGGKFVRSESGRVLVATGNDGKPGANYSRASRKDFRDAVTAARSAFAGWSKQSAYLRSQILYRAAEMLERREAELRSEIERGPNGTKASNEVAAAIDEALAICKEAGIPCGHPHVDANNVEELLEKGFRWLMPAPSQSFAALQKGLQAAGRK